MNLEATLKRSPNPVLVDIQKILAKKTRKKKDKQKERKQKRG
jgi:hypothetical protein